MVDNYIGMFVGMFFSFCMGGFIGGSMATGFQKAKFDAELKKEKEKFSHGRF